VIAPDPFTVLGLTPSPALTDEEVRAAWRRIAAATHPDRADGGDPDTYRAASAAWAELRTAWGRSEAYGDLHTTPPAPDVLTVRAAGRRVAWWRTVLVIPARVWHGRPVRLALRITAAAGLALLVTRAGTGPGPVAGLITGIGIWLVLTSRGDLAPPRGR
jgi:hypothetical protein